MQLRRGGGNDDVTGSELGPGKHAQVGATGGAAATDDVITGQHGATGWLTVSAAGPHRTDELNLTGTGQVAEGYHRHRHRWLRPRSHAREQTGQRVDHGHEAIPTLAESNQRIDVHRQRTRVTGRSQIDFLIEQLNDRDGMRARLAYLEGINNVLVGLVESLRRNVHHEDIRGGLCGVLQDPQMQADSVWRRGPRR
jgi:hypothetical protein